ncbi:MAG: hypothetical protein EOO56_24450 [Hymenobacter sp.]|nr:MAG: hypothetical protein EOO56_24450 [Hymenobacter sp.]
MSLDKTATVIQHLVDERNKPGYDLICKVFEVYPNVSKDWLLLGHGPMMLPGANQPVMTEAASVPAPTGAVPTAAKPATAPVTPSFPAALFTVSAARLAAPLVPAPVEAEPPALHPAANNQVPAEAVSLPAPEVAQVAAQLESVPAPAPNSAAPLASPAAPDVSALSAALHAQYLQHQLALAEQRNQHLLAQQQLMQQMLDLLRRPI